jgi:hypothetical protein
MKEIIERIKNITETVEGYEVKELAWLERDGVIRGRVKDPVTGRDDLHNGFVVATWRKNGSLMPRYGGNARTDLYLKLVQ